MRTITPRKAAPYGRAAVRLREMQLLADAEADDEVAKEGREGPQHVEADGQRDAHDA